uniref:EF-hand domain-containing protein n=1 Tax=Pyrodinium bahamense TaxID=73915 RepID=A0A7S0AQT2_9DINO
MRLMVCSILMSLASLSWALLLLFIIMYTFSIVFMQGAIMYLQDPTSSREADSIRDGVVLWYGSVFETMYTLLASIVGGADWMDVVRPLEKISMVYRLLFSFYIVFVVIGVLNVLTGIFVERACEMSGLDRDLVIQTQLKRDETFLTEMTRIFQEADADGSGTVTWEEFKGYLENDRVKAYFTAQQLDAFDARTLFDILNDGNGDEMNIQSFIVGCQRLKGLAKGVDLVAVLQETRLLNRKVKAIMRLLDGGAPACVATLETCRLPSKTSGAGVFGDVG